MEKDSREIPGWIKEMLDQGFESFYKEINGVEHYYHQGNYLPIPKSEDQICIQEWKKQRGVLLSNNGASLMDIGDGVLLLELHSSNMSIGMDILAMIDKAIEKVESEAYKGLIIGSEKRTLV